jgi:predicted phage baseplate assembly protein
LRRYARERAVLADEFAGLVLAALPEVRRAYAVARPAAGDLFSDEAILEVTILPDAPADPAPVPSSELLSRVFALLDERRLITTRVAVVPPAYRGVVVEAEVVPTAGLLDPAALRSRVEGAIRAFLDPLAGGVDGAGWPFGRALFRSELFRVLEGVDGVDHVAALRLGADGGAPREVDRIEALAPTSLMRLDGLRVDLRTG